MINVGLSRGIRGLVFPDRSFVFFPLHAYGWNCKRLPTYSELWLRDYTHSKYASLPKLKNAHLSDLIPELTDVPVHNDPDFEHLTYGHVPRGFGYEGLLESLERGDILLFLATLDYRAMGKSRRSPKINPKWGAYVVGAFRIEKWFTEETFKLAPAKDRARFKWNPHLYCRSPAYLWIAGMENTLGLFEKAVPMSSPRESERCLPLLSDSFQSWSGKKAGRDGWYRHAVVCKKGAAKVWTEIMHQGGLDE